ncbi:MAG TPA: BCAM0308 family protein [Planctomycetota bacterium]
MSARARNPGRKYARPRGVTARNPRVLARRPKAAGALVCADCGLYQQAGRWQCGKPPLAALRAGRCPACERVRQRYPAGTLRLPVEFLRHRTEVLRLIRNVARAEAAEHPLERLMEAEESDGHLVVTTTGVHLARAIAGRLARRFHRRPRLRYADGEALLHVTWE